MAILDDAVWSEMEAPQNNVSKAFSCHPGQIQKAHTMLRNLLTSPNNFSHHIRRNAAATVLDIAYSHVVVDGSDSYVALAEAAMRSLFEAGIFGTYLVEYISVLKYAPSWMPGASFKRKAREWRRLSRQMLESQFNTVKQEMANGTAVSCIATKELENPNDSDINADSEELIKNVTAIVYAAGADTTASAIESSFLAMVLHPDIQKRAQDEIDRVVGSNRLPSFADKSSLPYISCIAWECLRWNPVAPLVSHSLTEDDEYKGYLIPKGSTVLVNIWAILHDEQRVPQAFHIRSRGF